MSGVIEVPDNLPIGLAIDELALLIGAGTPADFDQQVIFIPIK